jgi:hydrogenase nickel incorporation protein HypB
VTVVPRIVEVRQKVLKHNDLLARELRQRFEDNGVFVVSLASSPGSGKTAFLEKTLTLLKPVYKVAALVGDLETDNDAVRLARAQVPVKQITTGTLCHLEAAMIQHSLEGWPLNQLDFLFIENVGNLVCPSSYDLGESLRIVLLSVTEGEDKPLKYPTIFNSADVAILTKMDLAEACEFDLTAAAANIHRVRPGMEVLTLSSKNGAGMDEWLEFLTSARARSFASMTSCRASRGSDVLKPCNSSE